MNKIVKSILTIVATIAIIGSIALFTSTRSLASSGLILNPNATSSSTANVENETNNETQNATTNESANALVLGGNTTNTTNTANTTNNTVSVNNINGNLTKNEVAEKDIPQTGENDIYIVSAIGVVALIIGAVSFVKSRE